MSAGCYDNVVPPPFGPFRRFGGNNKGVLPKPRSLKTVNGRCRFCGNRRG